MSRRFRNLLVGSTAGTLLLMLVGLYTAYKGAGLTCEQRWPLCDGWLGLFPANLVSFIEWSHRLLAMLVGFALLGVLYLAWRRQDDRRVKWAVTAAVALLPSQIILGALTVTEFTALITAAHFFTASLILLCLTAACAWTVERPSVGGLRTLAILAAVAVPFHLALDGSLFAVPVSVLTGYYALSFLLWGALAAGALWAHGHGLPRVRLLFALGSAVSWFDMLVARRKFGLDQTLTDVGAVVVLVLIAGAIWTLSKRSKTGGLAATRAD
ncbi:COX15/CtaA family protein [Halomicrobium sp. HM KBTZ05]|uniref:Cytochrome oxidase assembly n=1 Tax=Halomicrobium mukohataei TaxID=57705 RepID=A0A847UEW6_9EURY|nr:COX15/CtaA family protein [Halomicrobium mukohataei]NLV10030.1 cytochrome oxidase assembly [Halomicrobium mukohataei]